MNTETKTIAVSIPSTVSIAFVFLTGIALLLASGYAQATALHDAAHDQRHAMAFPCH
ncbi:MAG: CbtB domain-containing protein [Paracoccaceae bacterium]|jgi:cobalt transporter subunit CbtB